MDFQPFLWINLNDGNPDTVWMSRGQARPDVQPEWIRIDLAKETPVREIVLIPRKDGQGFPSDLTIRISRDAWHWTTVYENKNLPQPTSTEPVRFLLEKAELAKQIWIIGDSIPFVLLPTLQDYQKTGPARGVGSLHMEHRFALSEVQVIDESGADVALASRGAGVSVSSTYYGFFFEKEINDWLWPVHWDLGVKWLRVGHWDWATLQWNYVEQEKGKYFIDPETDKAITDAAKNGINIVMCLAYGNWLYAPDPQKPLARNIWTVPCDVPPPPESPEYRKAYCNFVRFMVRHFKDRVRWFEIWNEEDCNPNYGYGSDNYRSYCELVKAAVPVIKKEYPEAKISLGGTGSGLNIPFFKGCFQEGITPLIDAIGFHPFYSVKSGIFKSYPKDLREFQKWAKSQGFKGKYMATEWTWSAPYPAYGAMEVFSEIQKAKNAARGLIMHLGLSVIPFWVDTWCTMTIQWDTGLFRNTFASNPINQTSPQPVYYVYRTICTIMDKARPVDLGVELSNTATEMDNYNFEVPGEGWLVAVWASGEPVDSHPGVKSDVIIKDAAISRSVGKVVGIDTLNGLEQEIEFRQKGDRLIIPRLLVRDNPIVLRLLKTGKARQI
jgi:hypothetical protein